MLASSRGLAARHAPSLPSFLLPALQTTATTTPRRHFSATPQQHSKLGRTPISIPPGVELLIGEPVVKRDATSYIQVAKRTVTVTGPLGMCLGR